ncbi:MAG TPA: alpha/beta hydrolase [Anaerolineaceae bacterium]|nr:alpha/beta hydrolase [Anaerolineaceae bacterium]
MPVEKIDQGDADHPGNVFYLEEPCTGASSVVLLHGLGATSASWQLQTPEIAHWGYRVLVPDLPGFGQSTWGSGLRWSIPGVTRRLACFLERVGSGSAIVVGISMGGAIALQLALDHPQLVKQIALVNTFACLRPRRLSEWTYYLRRFALVSFNGLPAQAEFIALRLFPEPKQEELRRALIEEVLQSNLSAYRRAMLALAFFDVSRRLRTIHIPSIVITGSNDTTVPPEVQARLARGISSARRVIIAGAGHAVTADHPREFNAALKDWILDPSAA